MTSKNHYIRKFVAIFLIAQIILTTGFLYFDRAHPSTTAAVVAARGLNWLGLHLTLSPIPIGRSNKFYAAEAFSKAEKAKPELSRPADIVSIYIPLFSLFLTSTITYLSLWRGKKDQILRGTKVVKV